MGGQKKKKKVVCEVRWCIQMLEVAMATPLLLILLYLHYMFVLETLLKDGSKLSDLAWLSEPCLPCPHQAQLRTTGMDERKQS